MMYNILEVEKIENEEGEAQKLAARIKAAIEPYCVVQKCSVRKSLGSKSIYVSTTIRTKDKWYNGYIQNDPAYQTFSIHGIGDDDSLPEKVQVDNMQGGMLLVKPAPGSHYAYDSVKFGWRKKTGTPDQVVKHFARYFEKVAKVVAENQHRMQGE